MPKQVMTIGYEGRNPEEFQRLLRCFGVQVLVDVRERPLSRKKGFAKSALQKMLTNSGQEYMHIRALGSPAALRDRLHDNRNYEQFFSAFRSLMDSRERATCVETIAGLVRRGRKICLMCFEKDSTKCHRSVIADRLRGRLPGLEVVNL